MNKIRELFRKEEIQVPSPAPGTNRSITVYRFGDPGARPKVYIQTALHADEIPGTLILHHFRAMLEREANLGKINGEFIIVPVANPIGMSQRIQGQISGCLDINNGINYNRQFPDLVPRVTEIVQGNLTADKIKNDAIIRAAIRRAVDELPDLSPSDCYRKILLSLCADSDYCLDLHCDWDAILYLCTTGSHPETEEKLSATLGCETHLIYRGNSQCFDGSINLVWGDLASRFPEYPIEEGCLGCTIEYRGMQDVSDEMAKQDAENLLEFFTSEKVISGDAKPIPKAKCQATPLEAQIYIHSPHAGVVVFKKQCGEKVKKGDVVAEIVDPLESPEKARTKIETSISGIVMAKEIQRMVGPGQKIMAVAGKEIVPERVGTHLLSD